MPPTRLILLTLMRSIPALALLATLIASTGCHSPYVATTVSNRTSRPIELLEVDYPSDSTHQDHKSDGPFLKEGAEGPLGIVITDTGVTWQPAPTVAAEK